MTNIKAAGLWVCGVAFGVGMALVLLSCSGRLSGGFGPVVVHTSVVGRVVR